MFKTVLLFATGALCLIRGLHNPIRALVNKGTIRRCEGANSFGICDPSVEVVTTRGESVLATSSGRVVARGKDYVHVLVNNEPVILMYQGLAPSVVIGQFVSVGQELGGSEGTLNFSVTQMGPGTVRVVSPSAWLAARGCRVVASPDGNVSAWCAQPRNIVIPRETQQQCNFNMPEKAGFALFPVSIEIQ